MSDEDKISREALYTLTFNELLEHWNEALSNFTKAKSELIAVFWSIRHFGILLDRTIPSYVVWPEKIKESNAKK